MGNHRMIMSEGEVKYACYLASQGIPSIEQVDPNHELFNLASFDEAGNVKQGSCVIAAKFPKILIISRKEHLT